MVNADPESMSSALKSSVRESPRLRARREVPVPPISKLLQTSSFAQRLEESGKSSDRVSQTGKTWGRSRDISYFVAIGSFFLMLLCPLLTVFFMVSCTHYQCAALPPLFDLHALIESGNLDMIRTSFFKYIPQPTLTGFALYFGWLFFQGILYAIVPAEIGYGQLTPAGHALPYVVNGLRAWTITHVLFAVGSWGLNWFHPAIVHDYWPSLFVAANVYGYFLTFFAYAKAHWAPTHAADRKFSGSIIYDLFMGIEFNPRFGKMWDFKLFHNGRPGIIAWTMINLSFAAAQYRQIGYVTNSMILVNFFHALYVLDFFKYENWYLRTIDMAHDHFGFYFAWGDTVWLPFMYTLQSHFLVRNPVDLPWWYAALVLVCGLCGYSIFRLVNNQKDIVRRTNGKCKIWGKDATFIRTEYLTSDGKKHQSLLLTSGFWGLSRHFNYVGDLLLSLAMCLSCGWTHILPYFYIIYMTILLVQRIGRDDERCRGKYGKYWDQYCNVVRYKLIPFVF